MSARTCGSCTLCCKLLPVNPLGKGANTRCVHQRHGQGCRVYRRPQMPHCCSLWSCVWLMNPAETAGLPRPDRSHLVIDPVPDFITLRDNETGQRTDVGVIQVWIDPAFPLAHRDPVFRAWLIRQAEQTGRVAMVRYNERKATVLGPPSMSSDGQWHERSDGVTVEPTAERFAKQWAGSVIHLEASR